MTMTTESVYASEFLLSEANGYRSRAEGVVALSQTLLAGTILGRIDLGAATVTPTAHAGNTGTGSIGTVTAAAGAMAGDWEVVIVEPGTNAGVFEVTRPDGTLDGTGTVAVAYNGGINFTLADATDFVSGDSIKVNVAYAAGSGQYVKVNPAATDGSQTAAAISYAPVVTDSATTKRATLIVADAEVKLAMLDFGALSSPQKTQAIADLAALGIVARS